ncbi:EP1-like glycoprotein 2 [Camellia lanceoleosa]|uniref:EP1-like glycoprotein 2 n=1 Tax=Camellia lanceoleosa TaxID=1840588 RepID=A0ACC0F9H2_9ERIC|nr:EP1-like glycoprotein 2 [Camellia lanceoleosa]
MRCHLANGLSSTPSIPTHSHPPHLPPLRHHHHHHHHSSSSAPKPNLPFRKPRRIRRPNNRIRRRLSRNSQQCSHLLYLPFRLCFYNTPNSFVFAMRAGIPNNESLMRWVWMPTAMTPVGENATLSFGEDGNFVLSDFDGRLVWQTNTANKGVTGIKLLPNGNLVLFDKNGAFLWQSFDHPSDTLMVGMSVRISGRNKLVSRTSEVDGSDGKYSLVLEDNGFNMYINNPASF